MVPKGWKITSIGKHVDLLSGHPFKSSDYTENGDDIRLLRGDNIGQGFLRWRDAKRWPSAQTHGLEAYSLKRGDFVVAMDRTWIPAGIKASEVSETDLPCLLVQRVSRLRAKPTLEQKLIKQYLTGHRFIQYVKQVQTETAVPHISAENIRQFTIALPPIDEQTKISEILSTWDLAIETTEKLIENSRAHKKALMQQLLSGEKRLPGFLSPWKKVKLGSIGSTYGGLSGKQKADFGHGKKYIPYKNVFFNPAIDYSFLDLVDVSDTETQAKVSHGDIIFTTSSETPEEVGMSSVVIHPPEQLYLNSFCFGFRPNSPEELDPSFCKHFFRGPIARKKISSLAQGSTRYNLPKSKFLSITFEVPALEEQKAIAKYLDVAEYTEQKNTRDLEALKKEHSALLQQLLTGKRRVKTKEAAA